MTQDNTSGLPSVPWTVGDVIKAVVLLLVGTAALNVEVLAIMVYRWVVAGARVPLASAQRPLLTGAAVIAGEVVIFLSAWVFSVHKYGGDWRLLGYRPFRVGRGLSLVALVVLLGLGVNVVFGLIVNALGRSDLLPQPVLPQLGRGPLAVVFLLVAASLVAPFAEETFFRGMVFAGLSRRLGPLWGAVISAAMFAVAHLQPGALAPIFVLGLALAWIYYRTGSLWPCIITHATYNALAVLATVASQQT